MSMRLKKVCNAATTVLVFLVVILALLLVGVRLTGLKVYTVLSGSMEPTYHVGSLIYVKNAEHRRIKSGDVITFMLNENTVATHRVTEVIPDKKEPGIYCYRTKGDANESEDAGLVEHRNVIGTPVLTIPYLGYVAGCIQSPPGRYAAISVGAILLLLVFIPDFIAAGHKKSKQNRQTQNQSADPST